MAIDTFTKRASVVGVGRPWLRSKGPDATKGDAWRSSSGLTYARTTVVTLEQEGFRWRNDDGTEVTATWINAQDDNTGVTVAVGDNIRIRWVLDASGNPINQGYKIQFRLKAGPEVWRDVGVP